MLEMKIGKVFIYIAVLYKKKKVSWGQVRLTAGFARIYQSNCRNFSSSGIKDRMKKKEKEKLHLTSISEFL